MPQVQTIPASVPFVDALAAGLLAEAKSGAFALQEVLVLLPTRRACRTLRDAFLRRSGAKALLLPRIQPIGEMDADELLLDGTIEAALPPVINPLRRQLLLARLLEPVAGHLDHALRLADELCRLLDELQTERVPLAAIGQVVPERLAGYWQQTRAILEILAERWPQVLTAEGAIEPAERRHLVLSALAKRWRETPPDQRIVAAGSTGSIPATRTLLQVIACLKQGSVVLPGLDRGIDDASWDCLEPSHPQHGLKQLLAALGYERQAVEPWEAPGVEPGAGARSRLIGELMRPAATIAAWQDLAAPPPDALAGLSLEEHPDLATEALALALRMRAVLEHPSRSAALITPDRHLARRVAAELHRWKVEVDDSAGTPLDQSPPGAFLLLTARLLADGVPVVALLSALKHPFARFGREPAALRREVRELERTCLRGPRLSGGFAGMLSEVNRAIRQARDEGHGRRLAELRSLLDRLADQARAFADLAATAQAPIKALVQTHVRFAEALAADQEGRAASLWAKEAGEAAATVIGELIEAAGEDHRIPPAAYPALLALIMRARPVRPRAPRHPRLSIWGQLEGRLQHADLILLGGLNEGSWPASIDPGPWLNRAMRDELGLPEPERRVGLSAHDFVQAAAAPEVVISRAEKDAAGVPTVPSRWVVRLKTVLEATGASPGGIEAEGCWQRWLHHLDDVGRPRADDPPHPRPPLASRPRALSVSDVGSWMKNPYDLYARRILRLTPLDPLDADPGPLERGTIIHRVLERFVKTHPAELPANALQRLLELGRQAFEDYAHRPQVMALWWPRFEKVAHWVVERERERRGAIALLLVEVKGELQLDAPAGPFLIRARADRIERHPDGRLTIIDYKTGQIPNRTQVVSGEAPQLPLEAVMAELGCFEGLPPMEVAELRFWRLKGDETGGEDGKAKGGTPAELAHAARDGLGALIAHYDRPETSYPARPRPASAGWRGDYDHLARVGEWSS
jgi:ATP-dependent helicase/nuclease subunit B